MEPIAGDASLGDILEEDREPASVRENAIVEPAIVRRVVRFDLMRLPVGHGELVLLLERLPDAFRELGPDVLADQRLRVAAEHMSGVRVDVRVSPLRVEGDEAVARGLEHARERVAQLLALAATPDQLCDE